MAGKRFGSNGLLIHLDDHDNCVFIANADFMKFKKIDGNADEGSLYSFLFETLQKKFMTNETLKQRETFRFHLINAL